MSENAKALADFRKKLEMLLGDFDESAKRVVSQQAAQGMGVTMRETPVKTGFLKGQWKCDKYRKVGNAHVSGYSNNVAYAVFVNNGHRKSNSPKELIGPVEGKNWVEGKFMLEKGVNEADRKLPQLFDAEIARIKRETGF